MGKDHITPVMSVRNLGSALLWYKIRYPNHRILQTRLWYPHNQEIPKYPASRSCVHNYTHIYHKANWLLQGFDEWVTWSLAKKNKKNVQNIDARLVFIMIILLLQALCLILAFSQMLDWMLNTSSSKGLTAKHQATPKRWLPPSARKTYRKISNISRTKSQNVNDSRLVLHLSLPNVVNPGVKYRMKM